MKCELLLATQDVHNNYKLSMTRHRMGFSVKFYYTGVCRTQLHRNIAQENPS
jgi:hypothetical protein